MTVDSNPDKAPFAVTASKSWKAWAGFALFLMVYAWAYTYLGTILIESNATYRDGSVQSAYIDATYQSAALREGKLDSDISISSRFTRALPQYTDGSIDPLFPWLCLGFSDSSPEILFEQGRWLNMLLSCSLLILLAVGAARAFSFAGAAALSLMGGFGVILERSTYFSSDALYYLLVVLAWLCALSLLRQNHLWLYGVFGVLLAIAYLARASIWPLLAGFLIVSAVRTIAALVVRRQSDEGDTLWNNANQLVGIAILMTAFLLVAGPRMSYSATTFGGPFYSKASYLIWMDSSAEAREFFEKYSDAQSLYELAWRDRPGMYRFLEENGFPALMRRGWEGGLSQMRSSVLGRSGQILGYGALVFLVIASIHRWTVLRQESETWRVRGTSARWMLLFAILVFALTLFYSGVGNALVPNSALMTALFLPILLTFIWISERYRRQLQRSSHAKLVNRVYLGMLCLPIAWICLRIFTSIRAPLISG